MSTSVQLVDAKGRVVTVPAHRVFRAARVVLGKRVDRIVRIQKVCCRYFGISMKVMNSPSRKAHIVYARHVGMYLTRGLSHYSLPEIARRFGREDHTTSLYAVNKIEALLKTDKQLGEDIRALSEILAAYAETSA